MSPRLQTDIPHIGNDRIADGVQIPQDIVVPETQNAKASGFQLGVADAVCIRLGVLAAVDLYNQASFNADEIGDVFSDRNLAPKFDPVEPAIAEFVPKPDLRLGHIAAERTGKAAFGGSDGLMWHDVD